MFNEKMVILTPPLFASFIPVVLQLFQVTDQHHLYIYASRSAPIFMYFSWTTDIKRCIKTWNLHIKYGGCMGFTAKVAKLICFYSFQLSFCDLQSHIICDLEVLFSHWSIPRLLLNSFMNGSRPC